MYGTVTINVLANENVRSEKSLYGLDRISLASETSALGISASIIVTSNGLVILTVSNGGPVDKTFFGVRRLWL